MEQTTAERTPDISSPPGWSPDAHSLALLGDLAGVAWFQVDAERNVVAMSKAMEELTGISRERALGRPCIYLSRCHECLRHCGVFEEGRVDAHPLTMYTGDGAELPVSKSGQVILDEDGKVVGAVEVVAHLTNGNIDERCVDQATRETARIAQVLQETRYNRTEAAKVLGMSRTTLWRKMREYGL